MKGPLLEFGKTFGVRKELLIKQMDHKKFHEDTGEDICEKKKDIGDPNSRKDVLILDFIHATYRKHMEGKTGITMKVCLSLASL